MGLDLWFREDVARILASTWEAMRSAQRMSGHANADYQRGVEDTLRAVGLAFGLVQPAGAVRPRRHDWEIEPWSRDLGGR